MNPTKKNNGWILCPSKSFPGKFYYFNVLNGEAAWSLEAAKFIPKGSNIHRVSDKSHCYPEPSTPPDDDSLNPSYTARLDFNKPDYINTQDHVLPKRRIFNNNFSQKSSPIFGQAVFPKYVSNVEPYMPNIVWTPIQLPPPMYVQNSPEVKRIVDRDTGNFDYGCIVQACDTTLSKRFTKYNRNVQNIDTQKNRFCASSTPIKNINQTHDYQMSTPLLRTEEKKSTNFVTTFVKEPTFKRIRTQSESDRSDYCLPDNFYSNTHDSQLGSKKFQLERISSASNEEMSEINDMPETVPLGKNDLRLLLLAKRRKSVDLGEMQVSEGKKIKTYRVDQEDNKKSNRRVTFNLQDQDEDNVIDSPNDEDDTPSQDYDDDEAPYTKLNLSKDCRYVMVDPDTLVDEYQEIEQYVQKDAQCRLLLSRSLRSDVEAMCTGDSRGRQHVMAARQSARKLAFPPPYIVPLPDIDINKDTQNISDVLKYCLEVRKSGYEVVFITSSTQLYNDATLLKINSLRIEDIKAMNNTTPEITFDLRKVKFSVKNERHERENIFLKPPSEFTAKLLENNDSFPVNSFKKRLFDEVTKTEGEVKKVDANTSPIYNDRLIDITRKKISKTSSNGQNLINYENASTDIGVNIQDLFIKDKTETDTLKIDKEKQNQGKTRFEFHKPMTSLNKTSCCLETKKDLNEKFMDGCSKKFSIKNNIMENNIKDRLDEWICSFTQIMEDALTQVLTRHIVISYKMSPPWALYEVVENIKKFYGTHTEVSLLADKFNMALMENISTIGKLKPTMKPSDFMSLFEYGMRLIQTLKTRLPTYTELSEAEQSLNDLLNKIEDPSDEITLQTFSTPVVSRSEIVTESSTRQNFIRQPSEITDYLKKHFDEWKDYEPSAQENYEKLFKENITTGVKIVRTFGRNLKLLNIDNDKSITIKNSKEDNQKVASGNTDDKRTKNNLVNILEDLDSSNNNENGAKTRELAVKFNLKFKENAVSNDEDASMQKFVYNKTTKRINEPNSLSKIEENNLVSNNDNVAQMYNNLNVPIHANAFDKADDKEPSITRLIKPIQTFEDKLKVIPDIIDLDALDYSEIHDMSTEDMTSTFIIDENGGKNDSDMSIDDTMSFVYKIKSKTVKTDNEPAYEDDQHKGDSQRKVNNTSVLDSLNNDNVAGNDVKYEVSDTESLTVKDDCTNDSGFENESLHAHTLVRTFLSELSSCFKLIHKFIGVTIQDFRKGKINEEQKRCLHTKVDKLHLIVSNITDNLNSIIHRESKASVTLKTLLLKAGVNADDKRMTRYRQVVIKCLEQALTLENALKIMLCLTDNDCDGSISTCTLSTNIRYFNLFE